MKQKAENNQILVIFCGILIAAFCAAVSWISPSFSPEICEKQMPFFIMASMLIIAGGVYLFAVFRIKNTCVSKSFISWIFGIGLAMRLVIFPSTPILEDDFYRYFWDGAVLVNGFSPYKYAPQDVMDGREEIPDELIKLAESSGNTIQNVNYPRLRTIYPPLAQVAFGISYLVAPLSLTAWRVVLLFFDLFAFWLLYKYGFSPLSLLIYWWNPLLIKEIYNSCHVDIMLLPFLVMAMAAVVRHRYLLATTAVGMAVAIKIWPVLLMPVIFRRLLKKPKQLVLSIFIISGFAVISLLPFWVNSLDSTSGLAAYSQRWQMNDGLYMAVAWGIQHLPDFMGILENSAEIMPRMAAAFLVCIVALWAAWHSGKKPVKPNPGIVKTVADDLYQENIAGSFLVITAALYLLSPTQFPWYYLWMLPFLAVIPNAALLIYTALLPIYYLRPWFEHHSETRFFDYGVVWLQHGPVILMLIFQWALCKRKIKNTGDSETECAN